MVRRGRGGETYDHDKEEEEVDVFKELPGDLAGSIEAWIAKGWIFGRQGFEIDWVWREIVTSTRCSSSP